MKCLGLLSPYSFKVGGCEGRNGGRLEGRSEEDRSGVVRTGSTGLAEPVNFVLLSTIKRQKMKVAHW